MSNSYYSILLYSFDTLITLQRHLRAVAARPLVGQSHLRRRQAGSYLSILPGVCEPFHWPRRPLPPAAWVQLTRQPENPGRLRGVLTHAGGYQYGWPSTPKPLKSHQFHVKDDNFIPQQRWHFAIQEKLRDYFWKKQWLLIQSVFFIFWYG
jgi:hypothetical protein